MSQLAVNKTKIPVKIVILGSGGVGKTSLTIKYMYDEFVSEYEPTKTDNYSKIVEFNFKQFYVDVLDTAGQEDYASVRDANIRCGDQFILVFSLGDRESFDNCKELKDKIQRVKDTESPKIILVGNKVDIVKKDPSLRAISKEEAETLAAEWEAKYFETSASENINVSEIFLTAVKMTDEEQPQPGKVPDGKSTNKKKRCTFL